MPTQSHGLSLRRFAPQLPPEGWLKVGAARDGIGADPETYPHSTRADGRTSRGAPSLRWFSSP